MVATFDGASTEHPIIVGSCLGPWHQVNSGGPPWVENPKLLSRYPEVSQLSVALDRATYTAAGISCGTLEAGPAFGATGHPLPVMQKVETPHPVQNQWHPHSVVTSKVLP